MNISTSPYLSMLKAKSGECKAVSFLSNNVLSNTSLFFDMPRPNSSNTKKNSVDDLFEKSIDLINKSYGGKNNIYYDLFDVQQDIRCKYGKHPLTFCYEIIKDRGINSVPVFGFDRDDSYFRALKNINDISVTGICLRILEYDLYSPVETANNIFELIQDLSIQTESVDILIDLRSIIGKSVSELKLRTINTINKISSLGNFRSYTVAGSNFPRDMSNIGRDSFAFVKRVEYSLWKDLLLILLDKGILLNFGDYSIVHPDYVDLQIVPNANAKIRYTIGDSWLIYRGHSLRKEPYYKQYHELSQNVISSKEYMGKEFSWGDNWLYKCANRESTTGNLTTWVTSDSNHHIEFVSSQIHNHVRDVVIEKQIEVEGVI